MSITYISDGKAIEYTLPDGYSGEYISITPPNAKGKITMVCNTDYIITHGVIRFFRVLPEGAKITISNAINDIISEDTKGSLEREIQARTDLASDVDEVKTEQESLSDRVKQNEDTIETLGSAYRNLIDEGMQNETSFAGLTEASINNSLTAASLFERIRGIEGQL